MNVTSQRNTSGFTAVEVMVATVVLGIALVPLFKTMTDTGREAGFSESHLMAHARIQALLDGAEARGWSSLPASATTTELPAAAAAGSPPQELCGVDPDNYAELLYLERLEDGLVRLGARVRWMPAGAGRHVSEAASVRFLRRADGSWTRAMSLERPASAPASRAL